MIDLFAYVFLLAPSLGCLQQIPKEPEKISIIAWETALALGSQPMSVNPALIFHQKEEYFSLSKFVAIENEGGPGVAEFCENLP